MLPRGPRPVLLILSDASLPDERDFTAELTEIAAGDALDVVTLASPPGEAAPARSYEELVSRARAAARRLEGWHVQASADPEACRRPVVVYASGVAAAGTLRAAARRPTLFAGLLLRRARLDLPMPTSPVAVSVTLLSDAGDQPLIDFQRLVAADIGTVAQLCVTRADTGSAATCGREEMRVARHWLRTMLRPAAPERPCHAGGRIPFGVLAAAFARSPWAAGTSTLRHA